MRNYSAPKLLSSKWRVSAPESQEKEKSDGSTKLPTFGSPKGSSLRKAPLQKDICVLINASAEQTRCRRTIIQAHRLTRPGFEATASQSDCCNGFRPLHPLPLEWRPGNCNEPIGPGIICIAGRRRTHVQKFGAQIALPA